MIGLLQKIVTRYGRGIFVLVVFFLIVFDFGGVLKNYSPAPQLNLTKTASSILSQAPSISVSVAGGNLSGNSYKSGDSSAYSSKKITFGNANNVTLLKNNPSSKPVTITTGNLSNSSLISPLDFGANEIWYDGGYGIQDLATDQLYPGAVSLTKNIGVTLIRYPGGIPSDTFHWQSAIGLQNQRSNNSIYQTRDEFLPSTFGPDEFGELLQKTNSAGDITVNFGTGSAVEAADWVQYMTASSTTNYWGELRAKNGHPAPYNVPIWEVGNEQEAKSGENYWRSGSLVSVNDQTGQCQNYNIKLCEYVYGGTTSFSKQKALAANNKKFGDGNPSQVFFAEYPPIALDSQSVYVNGVEWGLVADISEAGSGAHVYELDNSTGEIIFGDGAHGAVVPTNAVVTISYQSGPHDGFIRYYSLMKAADPNAQICSSYDSTDFIQLMGASNPYDCLVAHLYAGQIPSTNSSVSLFHNGIIQQSYSFENTLSAQKSDIDKYAGSRAKSISIAVTEYGVNALTSPSGQPNYHRSQDLSLFVANTLAILIKEHIPIAEKHYLISYENSPVPGLHSYTNSNTFSNNALIAGPGSNPLAQPSAYALEAYSKLLYPNLIGSSILNNPSVNYSSGSYPALSAIATTDKKGNEAILVINLSGTNSVDVNFEPSLTNYKHLTTWTLGSNNYLTYNTPSDPYAVGFVENSSIVHKGKLIVSFPPSSITVLRLTN